MKLHPNLKRGALETKIEGELVAVAEMLVGDGAEDLQKAHDYDPLWFGGQFPASGCFIRESRGTGSAQDRGDRPSTLEACIFFYHPAMPSRGIKSKDEDRQQKAKRITRTLRDNFFLRLEETNPRLYAAISSMNSRGGAADEFGVARTELDNRGQPRDILWVDRSIVEFSI